MPFAPVAGTGTPGSFTAVGTIACPAAGCTALPGTYAFVGLLENVQVAALPTGYTYVFDGAVACSWRVFLKEVACSGPYVLNAATRMTALFPVAAVEGSTSFTDLSGGGALRTFHWMVLLDGVTDPGGDVWVTGLSKVRGTIPSRYSTTAGGFRLTARVDEQQLLEYTPANLPVGQLPVSIPFQLPAPGPEGQVPVTLQWAMSGSGAVYVDEVALDLCPATLPTVTPTPSPSATATVPVSPSPTAGDGAALASRGTRSRLARTADRLRHGPRRHPAGHRHSRGPSLACPRAGYCRAGPCRVPGAGGPITKKEAPPVAGGAHSGAGPAPDGAAVGVRSSPLLLEAWPANFRVRLFSVTVRTTGPAASGHTTE